MHIVRERSRTAAVAATVEYRQQILYIDDDPVLDYLFTCMWQRCGYRVSGHVNA